ncbi:MAG: hypothetical protein ACOYD4_03505 [Solirubrobacterales bacterium]
MIEKAHIRRKSSDFVTAADTWFHVARVEPGVHMVAEPGHVISWLIAGGERSILLDTGLGLADIAAAVATVCVEEPEVVNSHAHYGPHLICEKGSDLTAFAMPRFLSELADAAEQVAAGAA